MNEFIYLFIYFVCLFIYLFIYLFIMTIVVVIKSQAVHRESRQITVTYIIYLVQLLVSVWSRRQTAQFWGNVPETHVDELRLNTNVRNMSSVQ